MYATLGTARRWFGAHGDCCLESPMSFSRAGSPPGTKTRSPSPGTRPPTKYSNDSPHIYSEFLAQDTSDGRAVGLIVDSPGAGANLSQSPNLLGLSEFGEIAAVFDPGSVGSEFSVDGRDVFGPHAQFARQAYRVGDGQNCSDVGAAGGGGLPIKAAGPCGSLPKIESVSEKPSSAAHLGGQRRSLTGGFPKVIHPRRRSPITEATGRATQSGWSDLLVCRNWSGQPPP